MPQKYISSYLNVLKSRIFLKSVGKKISADLMSIVSISPDFVDERFSSFPEPKKNLGCRRTEGDRDLGSLEKKR